MGSDIRSFLRKKEKEINEAIKKYTKENSPEDKKLLTKEINRAVMSIVGKANYTQMDNAREIAIRHYISNIDEDVTLEEIEEILANRGDFTQLSLFQDYETFDLETVIHEVDSLAKLIISYA